MPMDEIKNFLQLEFFGYLVSLTKNFPLLHDPYEKLKIKIEQQNRRALARIMFK